MTKTAAQSLEVLASPVRRRILDTLSDLPALAAAGRPNRSRGLTAAELAEDLGLHVTTVRFHLDRLGQAGLVASHDERAGVGRPRRHFTATDPVLDAATAGEGYRLLAEVLADAMAAGDAPNATEAGRRWAARHALDLVAAGASTEPARTPGAWLAKVGAVIDMLDRWGYAPTVSTSDAGRQADICLHRCPLKDLAEVNPAVACGVHRGVIAGTLEALGEQARVSLIPFVEPDLCVAHVTTTSPFTDQGTRTERS